MIISSHLLEIVETKNKKTNNKRTTKKIAKKFRNKGEICYHSIPHWEEKNGNLPCAKGLICRPPAKAKFNSGKPIAHKCFVDNKKGRSKGNIHFASKKQREDSDSYLFSISYSVPKRRGREANESSDNLAKEFDSCYSPTPNYIPRNCEVGYSCQYPAGKEDLKGASKLCLKDNIAKENEECSRPIPSFVTKKCEAGFVCKAKPADKNLQGVSSFCLRDSTVVPANLVAKENEICRKPIPGFQAKDCPVGLECRIKDNTPAGMTGVSSYCLKKQLPLKEGEACSSSIPGFVRKDCPANLTCRIREADAGKTGVTSYCMTKIGSNEVTVAGEGQICANPNVIGFTTKPCTAGLTCRQKNLNGTEIYKTGDPMYCLAVLNNINNVTQNLKIGEKCSSGGVSQCPTGHICKYSFGESSGNTYCLLPSAFDTNAYTPYVGINNDCSFAARKCTSGSMCTRMFDGSNVCVAMRYDGNGRPMRRRRR